MTSSDRTAIGVIDIFAGPGGLGEGFASFVPDGATKPAFEIGVSAEMEPSAHATLRLRAFLRKLRASEGPEPWAYASFLEDWIVEPRIEPEDRFAQGSFAQLWRDADREALNLKLGVPDHDLRLYERIEQVRRRHDRLIVVGGPPCQAYSLVGRARNAKVASFRKHGDHRHFLYREYLGILARFRPDIFIMENVKGLLTSRVGDSHMLGAILSDLADPVAAGGHGSCGTRYAIVPLRLGDSGTRDPDEAARNPSRFILKAEDHGIPQARHRVILMGVREDLADRAMGAPGILPFGTSITLREALSGLPELRSGLSRSEDSAAAWQRAVEAERASVIRATRHRQPDLAKQARSICFDASLPRQSSKLGLGATGIAARLAARAGGLVPNHVTRGHMPADLGRYLYCALHGIARFASPSASDFPAELAPMHRNWGSGHFADRFRVQLPWQPSSTITSHISKDGHAFIHPDPWQCRSLTVREAARLQTFPDDYVFLGNRTQQYVQVGNAVPPLLAGQIAAEVYRVLS